MEAPTAQAPTAQDIVQNLYELSFDEVYDRIKDDFCDYQTIRSVAFQNVETCLINAYDRWVNHHDALGALTYLERVKDICNERLQDAYLSKYNESVSYLTAESSRAGTPVSSPVYQQSAHMRNLLLRVTACLH